MASSNLSPITRVPYDILAEIFIHCLPRYRLKHRQPDTTIAPMLLCHICSSWRTIALTSAVLWSHLSYRLVVAAQSDDFLRANWIVLKDQYTFLLWWKKNQGLMAPSLCLYLDWQEDHVLKHESDLELDKVGMVSLFTYISSAQYIEIDGFYWAILLDRIEDGYPIVHPNPRTLVKSGWGNVDYFYDFQLSLSPNHSPSALRHLYVRGYILLCDSVIPKHWSTLTHIALFVAEVSFDFWFSFIRAVPNLQFGHFNIDELTGYDYTQPTRFTLSQLSTFFITIRGAYNNSELEFPLGVLFTELHLPALHNLSLSQESWSGDHRALGHVYTVLNSTPAITTLTLGRFFLSLEFDHEYLPDILPLIRDVEPLWSRATHLVHLRLEAVEPNGWIEVQIEGFRDTLIRNIFHRDNRWLDLHNPACSIQAITIFDRTEPQLPLGRIANFTMSSIRKHAEKAPEVKAAFEVTSELESQIVAAAWNEWGPNLETIKR